MMAGNHAVAQEGAGHATIQGYRRGFILSIILTLIPFILVMAGVPAGAAVPICVAFAVVQIVVH